METPEIGDRVRVKSVVECDGEGKSHGYHPEVKGRTGTIILPYANVAPPADHPWRVRFDMPITTKYPHQPSQYFAASELELIQ